MKNLPYKCIQLTLGALLFCTPSALYAGSLYAEVKPQGLEGVFEVLIFVDAEDSINALEGEVLFTKSMFEVDRMYDGNSRINFWLKKPQFEDDSIIFGGITPGGFSGKQQLIFSALIRQIVKGQGEISFNNIVALRNDAEASKFPLTVKKIAIGGDVVASSGGALNVDDVAPPESFVPQVGYDEGLFEGKYFLAFSTVDKGSGILRYEVRESRFKWLSFKDSWVPAESPYVLADQALKSYIYVKAIDQNLNEKIVEVYPDIVWYENPWSYIMIGVILLLFYFAWKRKRYI